MTNAAPQEGGAREKQIKTEIESILEGIGWDYDNGGRRDANKIIKWVVSAIARAEAEKVREAVAAIRKIPLSSDFMGTIDKAKAIAALLALMPEGEKKQEPKA